MPLYPFSKLNVFKTKSALREYLAPFRKSGKRIGFVPTMGALHAGHISLVEAAKEENDLVVCSIFVNPTQFNDPEDLKKYPRPVEKDLALLEEHHCDVVFMPEVDEMYTGNAPWTHNFGLLETVFEGKFRAGHFKGVGQIVKMLFESVEPHHAYFGQKDFQQFLVIKKLVSDFHMPIELTACPIVREANGLAMSSRNVHLSPEERRNAGQIFRILSQTRENLHRYPVAELEKRAMEQLALIPSASPEYFNIVNNTDLSAVINPETEAVCVALVAVRIGKTRLIDNMILKP